MSSRRNAIMGWIGRLVLLIIGAVSAAFLAAIRRSPATGGGPPGGGASGAGNRPNILVFLIDDLDAPTTQTMLASNLLPNIKSRIVDGACTFQNAYVPCSICSPSRASLLTGKYSHNHGVWHVVGSEGPDAFDTYLTNTNNAYLPTWIGPEYHRVYVGKSHLGRRYPNWDFIRLVDGYDPRPGMYKATEGGRDVMPPVYQTKYIGDVAKDAIRGAGNKPFVALVSPMAIHVNVLNWRKMDSYANDSFTGQPVAYAQFFNAPTNTWRQHLVTADFSSGAPVHKWWSRDSRFRDSGWSTWSFMGDEGAVVPGTGSAGVVGWAVPIPASNIRRQQLVRGGGARVEFFTRDIVDGQPAQPWTRTTDQSTLAGTGSAPVVEWTSAVFPSGMTRQQVIRGDEVSGYASYIRHQVPGAAGFTPWRVDPDWGESVVFGKLCGFSIIPTSGVNYIVQLIQRRPGATTYEYWQSPEQVDFQELALVNNSQAKTGNPSSARVADEGTMLSFPFMKGPGKNVTISGAAAPGGLESSATIVEPVHPYYLMRAYAEGSWTPVAPGQAYDWGNNFPAGRLRRNREVHGFEAAFPSLDLPSAKASYNLQRDVGVQYYAPSTWPNLKGPVWDNKRQEDYLRRLHLDRMEQMISIDRMVGELMDVAGPNTIVIFTSDNGHIIGENRLSNKLTPLEESVRIPLFIKVPGGQRRQVDHVVANIDLAPTILDFLGHQWSSPSFNVDGRSLRNLVMTGSSPNWRRTLLLEYHRPRDRNFSPGDWRFGLPDYLGLREAPTAAGSTANRLYVQYYADVNNPISTVDFELYDMNGDRFQTTNLSHVKIPDLDAQLRSYYTASGDAVRQQDTASMNIA